MTFITPGDHVKAPLVGEPTANDILRNLLSDRSPAAILGGCEAFLGLLVSGFFGFCMVVLVGPAVLYNAWTAGYPRIEPWLLTALTIAWLPLAVGQWRSVVHYAAGLARARHPVPVHLAMGMLRPGRSPAVRLAVAVWWLANAGAVIVLAHWFVARMSSFYEPTLFERVIQIGVPVALTLGAAFAVNTHLLIAAYALTGSERLVRGAWRLRLVFDLALALLGPAVSLRAFGET